MSIIDKIHILGIRNFGPGEKDGAIIKFSTPLTLILGRNGCGKTTIIEALKYATSGDIPAGTDGGSGFVHDPELVNALVVRGQVKLRFCRPNGSPITIVRTVQVTRKAKKLEFKTLDCTFTQHDEQQTRSLSERCADIDATMCNHLGVSKAVLTNVIFCHQEDSAWPLDKGKKIKERFDAIFGITEYNKCLDHLRILGKEYASALKVLCQRCQFLGDYRLEAEGKRKTLSEGKARLTAINDQVEEYNRKKDPIDNKMKELAQKQQNYINYAAQVKNMKNRRELIIEQIDGFKQVVGEEYEGSKEELLREIDSFDEDLRNREKRLKNLADEKQKTLIEEKKIQNDISVKQTRLGTLQSNEEMNISHTTRRNQHLRALAEELGTTVMTNSQLNEATGGEPLKILENKVKEIAKEVDKLQEDQEIVEKGLQKKIDEAFENKARIETDLKTKSRVIFEAKERIRSIKRDIENVNRSSEGLGDLTKKSDALTKEKENVMSSFDDERCKIELEEAGNEIKNLELRTSELCDEIKLLQKVSLQREKLDGLNKRKRERETEFKKLREKHDGSLQHLLSFVPNNNFRSALERQLNKVTDDLRSVEKSINEKENKLTSLNTRKSNVEEQLKQKRKKCAEDESAVDALCRNKTIDEYLSDLSKQLVSEQDVRGSLEGTKFLYQRYLGQLQSADPICPVCKRDFNDPDETKTGIEDLENRIKQIPDNMVESTKKIEDLKAREEAALELKHKQKISEAVKRNEIPKLNAEAKSLREEISALQAELESQRMDLLSPQSDKTLIEGLLSDATLMDQYQKELENLEAEIRKAESELPSSASSKTMDAANKELEEIQSKLSKLRETRDEKQKKLSKHNETLKRINDELSVIAKKQLEIAGSVQKRKSLEERLKELENTEKEATADKSHAETQLKPVENEHREHKEKLSQVKMDHKRIIAEKKKKLIEYERKVDEVRKLQTAIDEYNKKGGAEQLQVVRSDLADLQLRKKDVESRKEKLDKERENTTEFLNKQELEKSKLDTSLKLMNKKEELLKVEQEIGKLEGDTQITDINQLERDYRRLEKEKREIDMQISNASGRVSELQSTVSQLERELKNDKYKDAEDNYRKAYVELTVKSKGLEEMKEYEKGMDWVMIHFHKDRMKRINEVIRELWRSIYRGNDIDWIEIKTEEGATTATGKRNYNYRVVQVKNNVELEMPGRCSAGQKVLACLIIRIALAETFSKNCGILALDEPTTNLDKVNAESLATALAEIVERRSAQRNFQLIVITHDKDFIDKLSGIERVEHYIEVIRNERGKSQVFKREF